MAMACLRLVTRPALPPGPERKVPRFRRRIALSTVFSAALPYLRLDFPRELFFLLLAMFQVLNFLSDCLSGIKTRWTSVFVAGYFHGIAWALRERLQRRVRL